MFMLSDIDLAVRKSKTLHSRLQRELYTSEKDFEKAIKSMKGKLPDETINQLHEVRKMRNDVVHEVEQNRLADRREFLRLCKEIEKTLDSKNRSWQIQNMGCVFTMIILAGLLIWLLS